MTLEIGTRLGHYRIVALLGRGGMADVYRAMDERLGREVALKALPPEFARDADRVERFEREVRAAARLNHPNIVTVYEFGRGEGLHFYTMALMTGGDLKARIRNHPDGMLPSEARTVARAMARALDYAHQRGFVHRDVKPENILFGEDGTAQLTDFGIARVMASGKRMTATGMSIGSPHYMSPEHARSLEVDGRSDLYSLGVVFYEMLTGRVPFEGADTLAVAYSHVNDPAPELPRELAEWQGVLDRLLAKSPKHRYGSARELAELLDSDGTPRTPARGVAPAGWEIGRTTRSSRSGTRLLAGVKQRRGMQAALAGGVLALSAIGIGYVLLPDKDSSELAPSGGGGGGAEVRPEPLQPTLPTETENPFNLEGLEPTDIKPPGAEPNRPEPPLPETVRAKPVRSSPKPAPRPSRRAPRPPARPSRSAPLPVIGGGALLVAETTPAGVEVLVDGIVVGKTPLERSDLRSGVREVTLQHPHYETVRESNQRFDDGRVVRIQRALVRGRGALTVTVKPREAWVEVEGKRLAERTPVTLEDLPAGRMEVRLGAANHRPMAVEVDIVKDGLARLEQVLERIPYGSLTVNLQPSDASVTFPDLALRYRPGVRLPEGVHRVVVKREGYGEERRTVNVSGPTRVRIALERVRKAVKSRKFDGMEFVWIPAGQFRMGSTSRLAYQDEKPVTRVRITEGFFLGKFEVTQGQWEAVMKKNPSHFKECGKDCPVESVSWKEVQNFLRKLNAKSGRKRYRLPTEAEWEYAARAGTTGDYYDQNLDIIAWHGGNSEGSTHPVGRKTPNGWGLHDMLGNVWELVEDRYGDYPGGTVNNPRGPGSGSLRVNRGGSWYNYARSCRSSFRNRYRPGNRNEGLGFRLLRTE